MADDRSLARVHAHVRGREDPADGALVFIRCRVWRTLRPFLLRTAHRVPSAQILNQLLVSQFNNARRKSSCIKRSLASDGGRLLISR